MCVDRWASLPVLCCQVKWVHWSCNPFLPQLQGGWRHISLLVSADPVHLETVTGNNNLTFNNSFVAKANILEWYVRHPTFNSRSLSYCWQGHNNLLGFEAWNLIAQKRWLFIYTWQLMQNSALSVLQKCKIFLLRINNVLVKTHRVYGLLLS